MFRNLILYKFLTTILPVLGTLFTFLGEFFLEGFLFKISPLFFPAALKRKTLYRLTVHWIVPLY